VSNTIKILGLNLDTSHTGTPHELAQASTARSRLPILKAVMGTDFGFQKEDGVMAYKAFIVPVFGHAGPAFYPFRSMLKAPMPRCQSVQNAALRVATGCHAAASVQHLHEECKVLPVADHVSMQCAQFLANSRQLCHPSFKVTGRPHGA
jgi:hypothetical protein